jgi:hypothetical protein
MPESPDPDGEISDASRFTEVPADTGSRADLKTLCEFTPE